jgi:CRISPR-associated protein Cas1
MTQDAFLQRKGETVAVTQEHNTLLSLPIHTLESIVCFGRVACSVPLMELCGERAVPIAFLSQTGRFLARVTGPTSGNVLLRRTQYRRADDEEASAEMARAVVIAKIANCRAVLQRALREITSSVGEGLELGNAVSHLARLLHDLGDRQTLDEIRGIEGDAARSYFDVFDHLVRCQKEEFFFTQRTRRPPKDNLNALLSFLYTLLTHDTVSALESVGLDPAVGFLHRDRPGRPGLALDLIEELRPVLADRLALSLVNLRQVRASGFHQDAVGGVLMDDATRKMVIRTYQERKQEEITHPFIGEKVHLGLIPYIQATLLARHLRGDLDGYPPFRWK